MAMLFLYPFLGLFVCSVVSTEEPQKSLNVGLITPFFGDLGFERVAAAATMGLIQAKKDGFLKNVNVSFIWRNSNCDGKAALGMAVTLQKTHKVDAYLGIPCSAAAINAGTIVAFWDLPHISYSSADPRLADKVMYNTLIRLMTPYNHLAKSLVQLLKHYSWRKVTIVSSRHVNFDVNCDYMERALLEEFEASNVTLISVLRPNITQLTDTMTTIKLQGRITVLCGDTKFLRAFMMTAHEEQMTEGDYVFLSATLLPDGQMEKRWEIGDSSDEVAIQAFQSLLQISLTFTLSDEAVEFQNDLPYKMALPPWNYRNTIETGQTGSPYSLFLYDSVYLYAMCADEMIQGGHSPRNGTMMMKFAKNKTFKGKSGTVQIDSNGDRIADYTVWHLNPIQKIYTEMAVIEMTAMITSNSIIVNSMEKHTWGKYGAQIPVDSPVCGFFGELCQENKTSQSILIGVGVVVMVLIVSGIIALSVVLYGRNKYQHELHSLLWQVKYEDIDFIEGAESFSKSLAKSAQSNSSLSGGTGGSNLSVVQNIADTNSSTRIGIYRGAHVAVNLLQKSAIALTRQDRMELKILLDFKIHENINTFVGVCLCEDNNYVLSRYCSKGSLKDVLQNTEMTLDMNFKNSLISDLIQGMDFIHQSDIKSHGRLKSANCVIDGRWTLKITDLGLTRFREHVYDNDDSRYLAMFWTAPELLRGRMDLNGTQPGDVYSFGIIVFEVLTRNLPYEVDGELTMAAKDIVGRVRNGETHPFRPQIPDDTNPQLLQLMQDCWEEDPSSRPDVKLIKKRFAAINNGKIFNVIDNMLSMLEKYANDLEGVVAERTKQLVEEKKKTDMLLYRMMPPSVANGLKMGRNVPPELYLHASVYFSDIVSFTEMSSAASPLQIVEFLNSLWTVFDEVTLKHDVYKVETIGDEYMVSSGVPIRNEKAQASEIANMALEMLTEVLAFKIPHNPEQQLQIRIGIHSGPVVAGVVGRAMPRYCLFGDTVNTASRMETSSEPSRIHISRETVDALHKSRYTYIIKERGKVELKGKGLVQTYWLEGRHGYTKPLPVLPD